MTTYDMAILLLIQFTYFWDSVRDSNSTYSYDTLSPIAKWLEGTKFCEFLCRIFPVWTETQWAWHIVKWIATYPIAIFLVSLLSAWYLWVLAAVMAWVSFRLGSKACGGKFFGSWFLGDR